MRTGPVEYAEPTEPPLWTTTYAQYVPFGRPLPSHWNVLLPAPTLIVPPFVPFQLPSSVVTNTSADPATLEAKEIGYVPDENAASSARRMSPSEKLRTPGSSLRSKRSCVMRMPRHPAL